MKKISILLMLCFVFSFGAFASNGITKEKIFTELCLSIEPFYVGCPDGGEFFGGLNILVLNCSTGELEAVVTISDDWGDNPCNEEIDGGF